MCNEVHPKPVRISVHLVYKSVVLFEAALLSFWDVMAIPFCFAVTQRYLIIAMHGGFRHVGGFFTFETYFPFLIDHYHRCA